MPKLLMKMCMEIQEQWRQQSKESRRYKLNKWMKQKNVTLQPVKFCASAKINSLSITTLLMLHPHKRLKKNIMVSIDNEKVIMGRWIKTQDGWVSGVDIFADTG